MNIHPRKDITKRFMTIIFAALGVLFAIILFIVFVLFTPADRSVLLGSTKTFNYDRATREYRLYVPKDVSQNTNVIVGLHGFGDTSRRFAYYTALHNAAPDSIVIYPQATTPPEGLKTGWNAQFCCGSGWVSKADDVGFILELIDSVRSEYGLDGENVFITGFSNGAFMSQRLITEHPEVFKAAAIASGSIGTTQNRLNPTQPIPVLLLHGRKDTIVPFDGGVGSSDPDFTWLSFDQTRKAWEEVNGDSTVTEVQVFDDNDHQWDDWRILNFWHRNTNGSKEVVRFFEAN